MKDLNSPGDIYISVVSHRWVYISILFLGIQVNQQAQILPDLEGEALLNGVVENYKPNFVEVYSIARELMYREIYNENDSVHTIYSGHKLFLPPEEELPIQFLAMNASPNGINTEHIYPRSKGAKEEYGNAFSDLHNLAPARWEVNEARANFVFGDINDNTTDCWFYKQIKEDEFDELPVAMIDRFAEVDGIGAPGGIFEPRESVKGDIARSVFYFFTMYRDEALREDPFFFDEMKGDLCKWHNEDPIDEIEMDRNLMKAMVQDGKTNPFIMDCSLANRLYCQDYSMSNCSNITTAVEDLLSRGDALSPKIKIYPNPNDGIFTLDISKISPGNYKVDIYSITGQLIYSLQEYLDYFNSINMWNAKSGQHIIHLTNMESGRKYSGLFEIIR